MKRPLAYFFCIGMVVSLSGCKCPFGGCQADKQTLDKVQADLKDMGKHTDEEVKKTEAPKESVVAVSSKQAFEKEVLQSSQPVIVDFSATWCGACKASLPALHAAAKELAATHKFVTINTDDAGDLAQEFGIRGIPTFIFFKDGKEVSRSVGGITQKDGFIKAIDKAFGAQ